MKTMKHFWIPFALLISLVACDKTPNPPNIIIFLADDLSYQDLSVYGQKRFSTPNLDRLAQEGIRFTDAYAGAPECAPSRASLLTGMHTGHATIRLNESKRGQDHLEASDRTIAEELKAGGYRTAFIGKWGIGLNGTDGAPHLQGFDYSFGYYDQARAHSYYPEFLIENGDTVWLAENLGYDMPRMYRMNSREDPDSSLLNQYDEQGRHWPPGLSSGSRGVYSESLFQTKALAFVQSTDDAPFFLYYATQIPHGPVVVDNLGSMRDRTDFPLQKQKEWAAMIERMDSFIGELVDTMKKTGKYENTVLIFSSDNGYSMCGYFGRGNRNTGWPDDPYLENKGPFRGGKFSAFEGGIRIPMFIHWPAEIQPIVSNEIVWLVDLFPTLIAAAGLTSPSPSDGYNLLPWLRGEEKSLSGRPPLYWERIHEQAVRWGDWKAYRSHPDSLMELYQLRSDSRTLLNLAPDFPEVVLQMDSVMKLSHEPSLWYINPGDDR